MKNSTLLCNDSDCATCGAKAEALQCVDCGKVGIVTNCGHYLQPRPIAGDEHTGEPTCDDCSQTRDEIAMKQAVH